LRKSKRPVPTPNLQRGTIGVNPENDILIAHASRNVGLANSSNAPINNTFAQVGKQIVDPFFHFNLEKCQCVFHFTDRLKQHSARAQLGGATDTLLLN